MITNLVFEGGGSLGMAYAGVVAALEDKSIMKNIERVAGSSAGSIIALCITLKYKPDELKHIMETTDFASFQDDSFGFVRDANRLLNKFGICKGKKLKHWIRSLIKNKVGREKVTFQELHSSIHNPIELFITGTNLSRKRTEYFSVFHTPTMDVATAVCISSCIPVLFKSIKSNNDIYVDGGVLCNYPLSIFDNNGEPNPQTLGFKLVGPDEKRNDRIVTDRVNIDSFPSFISELIELLLLEIERGIAHNTKNYWERTVTIPTNGLSGTNFDLTPDEMNTLYANGLKQTHIFLS